MPVSLSHYAYRIMFWWACRDSNPEPRDYESPALTVELQALQRPSATARVSAAEVRRVAVVSARWGRNGLTVAAALKPVPPPPGSDGCTAAKPLSRCDRQFAGWLRRPLAIPQALYALYGVASASQNRQGSAPGAFLRSWERTRDSSSF